ncbi:MAG: presenilin family intramembrane aspartyl protease [Nanoarchaeota archaeon]|nr:presenilin family intramembrane aspartyl protease [Nanoarchaeota archaeon]
MKHDVKITIFLIFLFVVTQFIGLYVVNHYSPVRVLQGGQIQNVSAPELPYGLETPKIEKESDYRIFFYGVLIAFMFAVLVLFLLTKFNLGIVLKIWFLIVITLALGIFLYAVIPQFKYSAIVAVAIAFPLALIKMFKRNFLIHNLTELFVYPGISAVFVPILNLWTIIVLLILISIYDMWAVWQSGIMQKMAKYQINTLNIFTGFFIPYASGKLRFNLGKLKKKEKKKKIKMNIAILGGGDIIFPIIASGVILKTGAKYLPFGLPPFIGGFMPAIFAIGGAALGLSFLLLISQKKKFYPAMPFITGGIFIGIILSYLISVLFLY